MIVNKRTLVIIILIIVNLLFCGTLMFTINVVKIPEIITDISINELNDNNMNIEVIIEVYNPNLFSITINNFNISSYTSSGLEFGFIKIKGDEIRSLSNGSFRNIGNYSFNDYNYQPIISKISGDIEVNIFGFIKKKLNVNFTIITQFEELFNNINSPNITINTEILELTDKGIAFSGEITIYNPNDYIISVKDIRLIIESESNQIIGTVNISSNKVNPNDYTNLTFDGVLSYSTLDANLAIFNFNAKIEAQIAGIKKIIDLSSKTIFDIPDLNNLLLLNGSFDFSISGEFKLTNNGLLTDVGLIVNNPTNISLEATDLLCIVSSVTNNNTKELIKSNLKSSLIPPLEKTRITTQIKIPYLDLFVFSNKKIFPDLLLITIKGNFSIKGSNQLIPLSFNGYVDLNLFY